MQRTVQILGSTFAAILTVFSLHAMAATQLLGRDFDHTATGFPLNGGHATAACESCHVAGVFKGTPKTCDGCHALGKRIVATPKPTSHLVTDAPCETCHFNTSTFLGARFNHATAIPGQCQTCHNGRITTGKPASHNAGLKATDSCDHCHRTYAFLPSSFNHVGVPPHTCDNAGCHVQGSNQYYRSAATHTRLGMATYYCDECHRYGTWLTAFFIHDRPSPSGVCMGCHDGVTASGKSATHGFTTFDCNACHFNTISWLGASYHSGNVASICGNCHNGTNGVKGTVNDPNGMHIPLTAGGNPNCDLCHISTTTFTAYSMNHAGITTCNTCHASTSPYFVNTKRILGNHQGSTVSQDCSNCHSSTASWLGASFHNGNIAGICGNCHNGTNGVKGTVNDPNGIHIPLTAGGNPNCDLCHISTTTFTAYSMNHGGITTCNTCHASTSPYFVNTKRILGNHQGSTVSQDCSNCHSSTASWAGALGATPAGHVTYFAGVPCAACHTGTTVASGAALHAYLSSTCNSCHYTGIFVYSPNKPLQQSSHAGNVNCSSSSCHAPTGKVGAAYIKWN